MRVILSPPLLLDRGSPVAKTPAAPAPKDVPTEASVDLTSGKGHATPSRAEQEAARKRPLVPDTKEAKARAKADLAAQRDKARVGMAAGDERYLTARDKGPQRKFARDYVDSGWHLGEAVMPAMVLVILATFIPLAAVQYYSFLGPVDLHLPRHRRHGLDVVPRQEGRAREVRRQDREGPRLVRGDAVDPDAVPAPAQAAGHARAGGSRPRPGSPRRTSPRLIWRAQSGPR